MLAKIKRPLKHSSKTNLESSPNIPLMKPQEAWHHEDEEIRNKWREALCKEFRDMICRGVWRQMKKNDVPKGRTLVRHKWVFKVKKNGNFWARLVEKGYAQIPGVDFTANLAPVVGDMTLKTMIAIKVVLHIFFWTSKLLSFVAISKKKSTWRRQKDSANSWTKFWTDNASYCISPSSKTVLEEVRKHLKEMGFKICANDNCLL